MRVLLFTVTAGGGHNATVKALACALEERGVETKIVDTYRTAGRFLYHLIDKGYLFVIAHLRRPYGFFYRRAEKRRGDSFHRSAGDKPSRSLTKKFKAIIDDFAPDVIVSSHVFPARCLDFAKEKYGVDTKMLGIVTDFGVHPYWEEALRFDRLTVPCDALIDEAKRKGFREEQILTTGIPIHPKFARALEESEAKVKLGLDASLPTLLLMNGSMGSRSLISSLRRLDKMEERFQIIVVCGNDKKTLRRIMRKTWVHPVLSFGFTDQIPLIMDASDVIITKPGGLTTSEALARRLPLISFAPIPGHEARNDELLSKEGVAISCSKKSALPDAVRKALLPEVREEMLAAIDRIRKPNAVEDLCNEILALGGQSDKA